MTPTPWGYDVDAAELPPLAGPDALAAVTGADVDPYRALAALAAASAAVRAHCGWHVSPPLACSCETSGPGATIALPTLALVGVGRVAESGAELPESDYEWRRDGLLRRLGGRGWPGAWRSVEVEFVSGLDSGAAALAAQVACQVAAGALATSAGVAREQAGDVSVTYAQPGGVSLLARDMEMLAPLRLPTMAG